MGILGEYRKATSLALNLSKSLSSVVQMEPKKEKIAFQHGAQREIMTNAFQAIVDISEIAGDIKESRDLKKEFETYLEDVPGAKSEKGDMWNLWQKKYKTGEGKDIVPSVLIQQGRAGYAVSDDPKGYFAGDTTTSKKVTTTPGGGSIDYSTWTKTDYQDALLKGFGGSYEEFDKWEKDVTKSTGKPFTGHQEAYEYFLEHGKEIP